jgi:regulator of cell morphogenesis and NO signaling
MTQETLGISVGRLVAERPSRSRVFERLGIDYCCGGKWPLGESCERLGLDAGRVLHEFLGGRISLHG